MCVIMTKLTAFGAQTNIFMNTNTEIRCSKAVSLNHTEILNY